MLQQTIDHSSWLNNYYMMMMTVLILSKHRSLLALVVQNISIVFAAKLWFELNFSQLHGPSFISRVLTFFLKIKWLEFIPSYFSSKPQRNNHHPSKFSPNSPYFSPHIEEQLGLVINKVSFLMQTSIATILLIHILQEGREGRSSL